MWEVATVQDMAPRLKYNKKLNVTNLPETSILHGIDPC